MAHSKHWLAPGALLAAAVVFALLGRWQLERAAWHRAQAEGFTAATGTAPLERVPAPDEAAALRYRPIRLHGHYEPARQILLDNMTSQGRVGYQVLTPFRVDSGELVLVNRGWLPASPDRSELPAVGLDGGQDSVAAAGGKPVGGIAGSVAGRIDGLPRAALALGDATPPAGAAVSVLSFPDFAAVDAVLGEAPARFQLLLDPAAAGGFERRWGPPADRAERSIGYAVQWFGLALLAFGLAGGVIVRGRGRAREVGR